MKLIFDSEEKVHKYIFFVLLAALFCVLVPMIAIATYGNMTSDDFQSARYSAHIWAQTHSILKMLGGQIRQVTELYLYWDGKYIAEFVASGFLGIFGENAYYICNTFIFFSLMNKHTN